MDFDLPFDVSKITGVTQDSRAVKPGYLFAALDGVNAKGSDYIPQALENGAAVIIASENVDCGSAQLIQTENPRLMYARAAASFYGAQPDVMVAVTGTNGKSSAVHFLRQLWAALGLRSASLGTLGIEGDGVSAEGNMTTPEPAALHKALKDLQDAGITHCAMEASSHGLDQYRIHGVRLAAAGFTNLSQDHLDYHGDMQSYFEAKAKLFTEVLRDGTSVINGDDEWGGRLTNVLLSSSGLTGGSSNGGSGFPAFAENDIISYGEGDNDLKLVSCMPCAKRQQVTIKVNGREHDFTTPLVGRFQVMNMLCALGLAMAEKPNDDVRTEKLIAALPKLAAVPGRLQAVEGHPQDAGIYVDYAHTPDALEKVLLALRPHATGKLICVFGCGGDRDKAKRPIMGEIAARLSDHVIVSDDNPRSENPGDIRAQIISAAPKAENIGDRALAIETAVHMAGAGDVVLIAGKGHETGQIFADRTEDFDDVVQAQQAISNLNNNNKKRREG